MEKNYEKVASDNKFNGTTKYGNFKTIELFIK